VFTDAGEWIAAIVAELKTATCARVATYVLDDKVFCDALLGRLKGRSPFSCHVVVDRFAYEAVVSRHERARLRELQRCGASVSLASGFPGASLFGSGAAAGSLHMKAVIVDERVGFAGSSNLTRASRINRELSFKIAGPPVQRMLEAVRAAEAVAVRMGSA